MDAASRRAIDGIIGQSAAMRAVADLIRRIAPNNFAVLIRGESGTGKELIARSIQRNSVRANGPFLPVNCGAIPETLMEAHLFGHQKGSSTGASSDKPGLFEAADGGTVFLDEIGEMPPSMQVKLLRAIQEKEVVRVGATKPIKVDVRLIAATNRELNAMIAAGQFRSDLYYRISTLQIEVPALRERREDIPLLAEHFLEKFRSLGACPQPIAIANSALKLLIGYHWPGNVRELENVVSRLVVLGQGPTITEHDITNALGSHPKLPKDEQGQPAIRSEPKLALSPSILEISERETMAAYVRRVKLEIIQTAMAEYPNRTAVAERLGLAEDTVRKQLRHLRNNVTSTKP